MRRSGRKLSTVKTLAGFDFSFQPSLDKHLAVANAAVIGVPDETRGTIIKAFIVLQPGYTPTTETEASIQEHVRGRLAPYQHPKLVEFIDALPMTTTGKVQRNVLRQREELR